jgi:hypothetical protein
MRIASREMLLSGSGLNYQLCPRALKELNMEPISSNCSTTVYMEAPPPVFPGETPEQEAAWRDAHRIHASYLHGQAQLKTAEAMDRSVTAQEELARAIGAPVPPQKLTAGQLLVALLPHMPQVTGRTELNMVDATLDMVAAIRKRHPDMFAPEDVG